MSVPGRARHHYRGDHGREYRGDRDHLGGHAERPDRDPDGQELPPSNKRTTLKAVEVIDVEDGKLKALRHYFDLMTLLQQIEAMDHADVAIASRLHRASGG